MDVCRILAVDDSPDALTILRLFLTAQGYEVITAESGSEALACVQERLPDLVITDYTMPGMTGLELCRHLRTHRETHDIPIVLHTGTDLSQDQTPLYDALCMKPADLRVLARRIRSLLPTSQPLDPPQRSAPRVAGLTH